MSNINVRIKLVEGAIEPKYQTIGSSDCDLFSIEDVVIECDRTKLVDTGVIVEIPEGYEAQIRPRSGLALKHRVAVLNTPGTVDNDYRSTIKVILINHDLHNDFLIKKGDRIAQMVFVPVVQATFEYCDKLTETVRGGGGFGSTGV